MAELIGREQEVEIILQTQRKKKAQLIAVYGRRRVGKTFLIRSLFKKDSTFIEVTGQLHAPVSKQLANFAQSLAAASQASLPVAIPANWNEAFQMVTKFVDSQIGPVTLFLDELPWLATPRGGLLSELDRYWNTKWSSLDNLTVVLCGSAASWMLEKLIHAKGGLHNRLTRILALKPLNLRETALYLASQEVQLSTTDLIELYLCTGGLPYYLEWINSGLSVPQLIDQLAFSENGILYKEYDSLLQSLFDDSQTHHLILSALGSRRIGMTRPELAAATGVSAGGTLQRALCELTASGFIQSYTPFGGGKKSAYYRIADEFTLFYHKWLKPIKARGLTPPARHWLLQSRSPSYHAWSGFAFEITCFRHITQILNALSIAGIQVTPSTWRYVSTGATEAGAQIDLILDRADRIINLCEIKFSHEPKAITSELEQSLLRKSAIFKTTAKTKRAVHNILISAGGLLQRFAPSSTISGVVTGEDLLKS